MIIQFIHGDLITPNELIEDGCLVVNEGKIAFITTDNTPLPEAEVINVHRQYLAPGCIDIHVHGGGGHDFMEGTEEAFQRIALAHAKHGTTALYATLAACPKASIDQAITTCEHLIDKPIRGAQIMGLHLEGNYLNPAKKGAQNPAFLKNPDPNEYKELLSRTKVIKRWSISPELDGALALGRYASQRGVVVSIAHTTAGYPIIKAAYEAGFSLVTHFYNAMTYVHNQREFKHEGTVESVYLIPELDVEVIADGIHVPPTLLQLTCQIKGKDRVSLITDAMAAAANQNQIPAQFKDLVIIEDGVCKLPDHSALASSIATTDRLIKVMVEQVGLPLLDVIRMASLNPAKKMHIDDHKGSLEKGKDADIIILNKAFETQSTFVKGQQLS